MAATVHTWTNGNADGDWNNGANWNTAAVPGDGGANVDTAMFDGAVTQTGPSVNLDRSADDTLYRLVVRDNFTGDIGGSGNPLIHKFASTAGAYLLHRGTGSAHYSVTAGQTARAIMDGHGSLDLDCEAGAVLWQLYIKRGAVSVASTCQLDEIVFLDGPSATLEVAAKAVAETAPGLIIINGGIYTNHREIGGTHHAFISGGKLVQSGLVADSALIVVGPMGRWEYTPASTVGAAHNPLVYVTGLMDTRKSNQDILPSVLVISQNGQMLGTAVQPGGGLTTIDLREEYP
jgi:hypothetical protein